MRFVFNSIWWFGLSTFLIMPIKSFAFTVNGTFKGHELKWSNAIPASGTSGFVLTDWTPISGIPTTTEWIPGNFISIPSSNVTLSGPGGSVVMPISLKGVEYNWSSASATIGDNTLSVGTICNVDSVGGSIAAVADDTGSPCVSGSTISYNNSIAPFYFVRPIFDFNVATFDDLFKGKEVGVYTGTISTTIRYYYRATGGALSYFVIPQSLAFVIDYQPAILTEIEVNGDGVITPIYDSSAATVSGITHFDMIAKGVFTNGLKLSFDTGHSYSLYDDEKVTSIPYSIVCSACQDTQIVRDGVYQLGSSETVIPFAGKTNSISFRFDISFSNVDGKDLVDGNYSDTFIVFFEENL